MRLDRESDAHLLGVLIAGFTLLLLSLLASGLIVIDSTRSVEADAARLLAEQQATVRLIDEVQGEEGNLSGVFYSLAAGRNHYEATLLRRLNDLESAIHRTTDLGRASGDSILWNKVRRAADAFIAEGKDVLQSQRQPGEIFFKLHQNLLDSLAELTASSFMTASSAQQRQADRASSRIRSSLVLLCIAFVVAGAGAVLTVYTVNRNVRRLQWQAFELSHLSSRTMSDQEETARRLSREMHDHFGQTLSAIEANLVAMKYARSFNEARIEDCLALIKDAVANVREVSQLLRPSILDDFGLNASLRWLAETFSERTGIKVHFESTFSGRLQDNQETQLFRIAQESLTNIARHSGATEVQMALALKGARLRFSVSDNGKGTSNGHFSTDGLGLIGMRARARAAGGTLDLESKPGQGFSILVQLPREQISSYASQNSHPVGG